MRPFLSSSIAAATLSVWMTLLSPPAVAQPAPAIAAGGVDVRVATQTAAEALQPRPASLASSEAMVFLALTRFIADAEADAAQIVEMIRKNNEARAALREAVAANRAKLDSLASMLEETAKCIDHAIAESQARLQKTATAVQAGQAQRSAIFARIGSQLNAILANLRG